MSASGSGNRPIPLRPGHSAKAGRPHPKSSSESGQSTHPSNSSSSHELFSMDPETHVERTVPQAPMPRAPMARAPIAPMAPIPQTVQGAVDRARARSRSRERIKAGSSAASPQAIPPRISSSNRTGRGNTLEYDPGSSTVEGGKQRVEISDVDFWAHVSRHGKCELAIRAALEFQRHTWLTGSHFAVTQIIEAQEKEQRGVQRGEGSSRRGETKREYEHSHKLGRVEFLFGDALFQGPDKLIRLYRNQLANDRKMTEDHRRSALHNFCASLQGEWRHIADHVTTVCKQFNKYQDMARLYAQGQNPDSTPDRAVVELCKRLRDALFEVYEEHRRNALITVFDGETSERDAVSKVQREESPPLSMSPPESVRSTGSSDR